MTSFNWNKVSRQRMDNRKSVRLDTFKKTKQSNNDALWHSAIQRETVFLSGKYIHKNIEHITRIDPRYCVWVIDNQPNGIVARQLLRHYNRKSNGG